MADSVKDEGEKRLDELEEHIQEARRHADEALHPESRERHFYDSGTEGEELDDQEIAPPG
jgi:hypothetical protein